MSEHDGHCIVLLPLRHLPVTDLASALRAQAAALRDKRRRGQATPDEVEALRALDKLLGEPAPPDNGHVSKDPPLLLKIVDVARLLGVSRAHVGNLVARHEIPSVKIGTCRRVRRDQLLEWLNQHTENQQMDGWRTP